MRTLRRADGVIFGLLFVGWITSAAGQTAAGRAPVELSVVDENGMAVPGAEVILAERGRAEARLLTDYAGHVTYVLDGTEPYHLRIEKPGFYQKAVNDADPMSREIRAVLNHEQMVLEQVSVMASVPGIDAEQMSDKRTMNLPEIINVPYTTTRDIRNLLPFYPGVVADATGQVHVAGSETWATLDTLDGFDIRSQRIEGNAALYLPAAHWILSMCLTGIRDFRTRRWTPTTR